MNILNDNNNFFSFSETIYNLIPKNFAYSFSVLLKKDYYDLINKISNDYLISPFNNNIKNEINNIKNILSQQENNLKNKIKDKESLTPNENISDIINEINIFISTSLFDIQKNLEFSISNEKKKSLNSLIKYEILPKINAINEKYKAINSDKFEQFQSLLDSFPDYSENINDKLNSETIIDNSQNVLNSLKEIIQNEILNHLKESFINLETFTKDIIDTTLENVVEKRNLVEVHNNRIQSAFDEYKNDYFVNINKLKETNEIFDLQQKYSNFKSVLNNTIKNVGNPITNSLDILEKELNQSQYFDFKEKLNTQLKNIKDSVNNLLNEESKILDESLNLVKNILPELFISNQNIFKNSIDESLLYLYKLTLPNVKNVDIKNSGIKKNIKIGNYKAIFSENAYHIINSAVNQLKYENSIKIIYNNDYTFTVDLTTKSELYLESSFETKNVFRGGFRGIIANTSISISSHNNFVKEQVKFKAISINKGTKYDNWIQYKNVKVCKRLWFTLWIKKNVGMNGEIIKF